MINRRGGQDGAPPCVLFRGRLDLPDRPIPLPAARSPPLAQELELRAKTALGQAVGPR